jgi:hypothetical protein
VGSPLRRRRQRRFDRRGYILVKILKNVFGQNLSYRCYTFFKRSFKFLAGVS